MSEYKKTHNFLGSTELIVKALATTSHTVHFEKRIPVSHSPQLDQQLRFSVLCQTQKESLGQAECNLSKILTCEGSKFHLPIHTSLKHTISLDIISQPCRVLPFDISFQCSARTLKGKKHKTFSVGEPKKPDPYLEIFRQLPDLSFSLLHRTEIQLHSENPKFNSFSLPLYKLNDGDDKLPLQFNCVNYNQEGKPVQIGSVTTSIQELKEEYSFDIINPKKKKKHKKHYTNSGLLFVQIKILKQKSVVDYLRGGYPIHLNYAIDFTTSTKKKKLHQIFHETISVNNNSVKRLNPFEFGIAEVSGILFPYSKRTDIYGFGDEENYIFKISKNREINQARFLELYKR